MKKFLLFQPGYFSGSKVDFRQRMMFLEKLTKPAKNSKSGFAFTTPPVCRMRLGDWLDHYVIIETVDYDYKELTWTLDGNSNSRMTDTDGASSSAVQPLMVGVTISFKIIGQYQSNIATPPLANDDAGFFGIPSINNRQSHSDTAQVVPQA